MTNKDKVRDKLKDVRMTFISDSKGDGVFTLDGENSFVFADCIFNVNEIRRQLIERHAAKAPPERTVIWSGCQYFIMEDGKVIAQRAKPFTLNELEKYEN